MSTTKIGSMNSLNLFITLLISGRCVLLFEFFLLEKLNKYRFIFNNYFFILLNIYKKKKKSYLIIIRETKKSIFKKN